MSPLQRRATTPFTETSVTFPSAGATRVRYHDNSTEEGPAGRGRVLLVTHCVLEGAELKPGVSLTERPRGPVVRGPSGHGF